MQALVARTFEVMARLTGMDPAMVGRIMGMGFSEEDAQRAIRLGGDSVQVVTPPPRFKSNDFSSVIFSERGFRTGCLPRHSNEDV